MGALIPLLLAALPAWSAPAARAKALLRPPLSPAVAAPTLAPALHAPALGPTHSPAPAISPAPPLDLSPAAGVYERRGVGLLAVDLKDSTLLHQSIGNRKAHAWSAAVLDLAESAARDFDGAVVRRMGDGYLMLFPDPDRAMRAAASIQSSLPAWRVAAGAPGLELRAAVHAGRVLVDAHGRTPEAYGQNVERVLALVERSAGGEVAADPAVADFLLERGWRGRVEHFRSENLSLLRPSPAPEAPPLELKPDVPIEFISAATLFTSLVDWPAVFERHGRRRAYATVKAFHAHVEGIVLRHGGFVVKTSGDTVMASFPGTEAAVKAGLELQSRLDDLRRASPLGRMVKARVGISAGRVLRETSGGVLDHFGNTVNAAARLMKRAEPGQVLVSARALDEDPAAAALGAGAPRHEVNLKGFRDAQFAAALSPVPAPADRAASRRLSRIARQSVSSVPVLD